MANQYVNKVEYGSDTLIDLTSDTVTASTLLSGYTAHDRSGAPIVGVAVSGGYTVNFSTTNSDLYGATITIKQGSTVIGTVAFDNTGSASYTLSNPGTYTWSVTLEGETYTDTFVIATQEVYIETTFVYRDWLIAGGLNPSDYADLPAVLADEEAVRQLMTIHTAVDYLASFESTDASVVTILNNDYAAKWISLTDYAMDTLEAAYGTLMGTIGKYGYGEWGITDATTTPPTWGALGNVPVMTSNTAPYGEANQSSYGYSDESLKGWNCFVADDGSHQWCSALNSITNQWVQYKFPNPVKALYACLRATRNASNDMRAKDYKIQASNDGTTFVDLTETLTFPNEAGDIAGCSSLQTAVFTKNVGYYLYYRFLGINSASASHIALRYFQLFGRTLKVSVPKMSGNTTPYGEASATSIYSAGYEAYRAFDKTSTPWIAGLGQTNNRLSYKFNQKVRAKKAYITTGGATQYNNFDATFTIHGSNDGTTWSEALATFVSPKLTTATSITQVVDLPDGTNYQYYSLFVERALVAASSYEKDVIEFQIFGKDYSEREWDTSHPRRYLYDHGVEVETLTAYTESANAEKKPSELKFALTGTANSIAEFYAGAIDFTDYSLMRAAAGDTIIDLLIMRIATATPYTASMHNNSSNYVATVTVNASDGSLPENLSLDLSSVSGTYNAVIYVAVGSASGSYRTGTIKELWLE